MVKMSYFMSHPPTHPPNQKAKTCTTSDQALSRKKKPTLKNPSLSAFNLEFGCQRTSCIFQTRVETLIGYIRSPTGFLEETTDEEDSGKNDNNIPLAQHQDVHSYNMEGSVCGDEDLEEVPTGFSEETPAQEDSDSNDDDIPLAQQQDLHSYDLEDSVYGNENLKEQITAVTVSDPILNDVEIESDVGSALVCEHPPTLRDIKHARSEQSACSPDSYHNSLGKALAEVLGSTSQVKELDQLKGKLKSAPQDKYAFECYMNSLAPVQTKVLQQKSILKIISFEASTCISGLQPTEE